MLIDAASRWPQSAGWSVLAIYHKVAAHIGSGEGGYIMRIAERLSPASANSTTEVKRIVVSSVIGTAVEGYDFLIYGTASALVFNKLFFPTLDPVLGTIAHFAIYAVDLLPRPLGTTLFVHFVVCLCT